MFIEIKRRRKRQKTKEYYIDYSESNKENAFLDEISKRELLAKKE